MNNDIELIHNMNYIARELGYEVAGVEPTKHVLVWYKDNVMAEISAGHIVTNGREFLDQDMKLFEEIRDLQTEAKDRQ